MQTKKLYNGIGIPMLGYGVYQVAPTECYSCVREALDVGYRHIDTAQAYYNEEQVGQAIKDSGIDRKDIFITSKVWITNYGYEKTIQSVEESLRKLQTDYLDLMLLHQPFSDYHGAWRALEDLYGQGKIKAIGVSNFPVDRLIDMCLFARIKPMVNQIEVNPFYQQKEAVEWAKKYDVAIEAWAPFGEGRNNMFTNPTLTKIGAQYGKTPAQVILRWLLQRDIIVFPKSVHKERMEQNYDVFDFSLSDKDMETISQMDTKTSLFFDHTDPNTVEWFGQVCGALKK